MKHKYIDHCTRPVIRFLAVWAFIVFPVLLHAQHTWSVSPGAVIPTANGADTQLIVQNAPNANFDIDFNTGGSPRIVGEDIENSLSVGISFSFSRGFGSGGFSFNYEVTYRLYLLPTNNPDQWVVAMDYKSKAWGWSRSGTLYLWKIDKANPTQPLPTSPTDPRPTAAPSGGGSPSAYNDSNENGWNDYSDLLYQWEWAQPPEGQVILGECKVIDSQFTGDYDGWFEYDWSMRELLELTADS